MNIGGFGDEAIATFIAAAVGLLGVVLGVVLGTRLRRRRALHILCQEVMRTSLIDIPQEVMGSTPLSYGDTPVTQLSWSKLCLRNSGDELISEPTIMIEAVPDVAILDVYASFESGGVPYSIEQSAVADVRVNHNHATIKVDHLSPYRDHEEQLILNLFFDGKISDLFCRGRGLGWSVKIHREDRLRRRRAFLRVLPVVILLLANLMSIYLSSKTHTPFNAVAIAGVLLWVDVAVIGIVALATVVLPNMESMWQRFTAYARSMLRVFTGANLSG